MHHGRAPLPPRWLTLGLAIAATLVAGTARAQPLGPISPAQYFAPFGYRPKEFTLVRDTGWFHLFYIRENIFPGAPSEQSLGHAISRDLYTWTEQDTILPVLPGTFEGSQIWAPHLAKIGATWHLFYAVMHDDPANGYHLAQSITEATSTDLVTWTRRDQPLFDNAIFPWAYYDTTANLGRDCRDPYLWWDPATGEWLMYVATRPAFNPAAMMIGIAGSTDLEHWEDRGAVPITLPSSSFSDVAESPTILSTDPSRLILLWTTDSGNSLTYGLSGDAVTGWHSPARLRSMLGYTTVGWWGSETLADGNRRYFASVDDTWLQFWDMTWTTPDVFALAPPNPGQILDAGFDRHDVVAGDTLHVFGRMVHGAGHKLALRYVRVRAAVADTLVGAGFGLPDSLAMNADSTAMVILVPASLGGGQACRLDVSTLEGTAPADTLRITPPDAPDPEPLDPVLPLQHTRLLVLGRLAEVHFVRERAVAAWTGEVFDVRGRRLWQGRAESGQRTLVWRPGRDGVAAAAAPGIYFARLREAGGKPETLKIPWVGAR